VGRREQNKADKLSRIKTAARKLFMKKGYEETCTREIAEEAGLSVGTVFFYARDKGDLCCLMAVDRIHGIFARSFNKVDRTATLVDQLSSFFSPAFVDAAKNPELSRILIKEMVIYKNKVEVDGWVTSKVEKLLDQSRERGEVEFDESPEFVARTINQLYLAEMRDWIVGDSPSPKEGLKTLRRGLLLFLEGLKYNPISRARH
jgi:AcrR family transcriptional regulator